MSQAGFERELSALRLDLESRDDEVRRLATESLLALPTELSLSLLVESLGDSSWRVRKAAVDQLAGSIGRPEVVRALIEALADESNSGRRNSALEALVGGGADVVAAAVDGLGTDDVDVRKQLVDTLAGIGDERAREPLLRCLRDVDPNVRGAAADALGAIGGAEVEAPLEQHAADAEENPLVRVSALRALAALQVEISPERLGDALDNPVLRPQAYAVLAHHGESSTFEVLLEGLKKRGRSTRAAAISALVEQVALATPDETVRIGKLREASAADPDLLPWVAGEVNRGELTLRLRFVQFLSLLAEPAAVVPIVEASCDPAVAEVGLPELRGFGEVATRELAAAWAELSQPARVVACRVVATTGGREAAELLESALEEREPELRMAAASAAAALGIESAVPILLQRIDWLGLDEDAESDEERAELTEALRSFANPVNSDPGVSERTLEFLAAKLDGSIAVRLAIARAIGSAGGQGDAIATRLLKDPSARVRRAAIRALARSDSSTVIEALRLALADETASVRAAAARELARTGDPAVVEDLARLAREEEPDVRAVALTSIARLASDCRDPKIVGEVLELVGSVDTRSATVAIGAVEALDAIATAEAGRLALVFLQREEPELLQLAIGCVGRHADRAVLSELLPLVSHSSWSVRAETIRVLGERGFVPAVTAIMRRQEREQHELVREAILGALRRMEA